MGVKVLPQKRTVVIITVLFWVNTFTPMGLHSSGYGISLSNFIQNDDDIDQKLREERNEI